MQSFAPHIHIPCSVTFRNRYVVSLQPGGHIDVAIWDCTALAHGKPQSLSEALSENPRHTCFNYPRRSGRSRRLVVAGANAQRENAIKGTGLGARERRLQKVQEEKRRRESKNKYPEWATILEEACKDDVELREIIGDSVGDPEEMRRRVEERVRKKGRDLLQPKTGSAIPMKVAFREFDATDSYIWIELYSSPSEKDIDIIGSVIRSWYLLGRLGGFNSLNMQITQIPLNQSLSYNNEVTEEVLSACFHNIGDLEFQDNWGRFWVDLGTADPLALDVFINSFSAVSSDHVGIKELTFGGKRLGDWEEGMTAEEDGYKIYKI